MKIWHRITLITFVLFIASIFYWALYAPKQEISERIYETLKEQEGEADLSFKDVTFEEVVAAVKYWELSAKTAMVNKSTGIATLRNAGGTFFKDGKAVLRFRSPAALWDMKKKEILLDKPLGYDISLEPKIAALIKNNQRSVFSRFTLPRIAQKESGYWFQAKNLSWKLADQKLLCTGGIVLNKGEVTGYSSRLEGDVGFEKVFLEGDPKIIITPPKTSPISLEADVFEVENSKDVILAHGNPIITWEEAKVTADDIKYLQVTETLKLNGSVKIKYKNIRATGNSASYLTSHGRIDIEGDAFAQQGENKLSGQKISVSLKDNKISVMGKGKVIISEE